MIRQVKLGDKGFTLAELMIATSVFSVIMMISLYSFVQIGRYYTRGINIVRTQDAIRNLESDLTAQIQLTAGNYNISNPSPGVNMVCFGNKAYIYQYGVVENGTGNAMASYRIPDNTCNATTATEKEVLLKKGTRVLDFSIQPSGDLKLFEISVAILNEPDQSASGVPLLIAADASNPNDTTKWKCKTGVRGSEYCSLSRITTSVYRRVI